MQMKLKYKNNQKAFLQLTVTLKLFLLNNDDCSIVLPQQCWVDAEKIHNSTWEISAVQEKGEKKCLKMLKERWKLEAC